MREYYGWVCAELSRAELESLITGLKAISRRMDRNVQDCEIDGLDAE